MNLPFNYSKKRQMIKMIRFFSLTALLILFACEKNSDEDFALAYAELRIAEREYGDMEDGKAIRFQILQKHGFYVDDFEKRIEEIKKKPEKWLGFQNKLTKILDSIANSSKSEEEN